MYTTEGIVLKRMDIGEADVLYSIYTKDYGKIRAVAQGVRKPEAKLRGHLEPLSLSSIRFVIGRGGEKLIAASLVNFWHQLRAQETTLRLGSAVAAAIDEHCFTGQPDDGLWHLVHESFTFLDRRPFPEEAAAQFLNGFQARLRDCLGYGRGEYHESGGLMVKSGRLEYH